MARDLVHVLHTGGAAELARQIGKRNSPDFRIHTALVPYKERWVPWEIETALKAGSDMIVVCVGAHGGPTGIRMVKDLHRLISLHDGPSEKPLVGLVTYPTKRMLKFGCGYYSTVLSFFCGVNGNLPCAMREVLEKIDIALVPRRAKKLRDEQQKKRRPV